MCATRSRSVKAAAINKALLIDVEQSLMNEQTLMKTVGRGRDASRRTV